MNQHLPDVEAMRVALGHFLTDGAVHEIRIPNVGKRKNTNSGYYDDADAAARDLAGFTGEQAPGIYITVNPCVPALLSRAANRLQPYASFATGDVDILGYRRLFIDIDAKRPAGICATEAERAAAVQRAKTIAAFLADHGWPPCSMAVTSGNGAYLVYDLDLPNDSESRKLIDRVLTALAELFNDDHVGIDTGVGNPARIMRLPGTWNAKGDNTDERPWRLAVARYHDDATVVTAGQITQIIALAPAPERPMRMLNAGSGQRAWRIQDVLHDNGIQFAEKPRDYGTVFELQGVCLTSTAHTSGASVIEFPGGKLIYSCLHESCRGKRWSDAKQRLNVPHSPSGSSETGPKAHSEQQEQGGHQEQGRADAWDTPKSLEDMPLPPFPVDALDSSFRLFATALADATETDPGLSAPVCLGSIGTAATNKFVVEPDPGYTEPTNAFIAPFLHSGNRKSQVFKQATEPITSYERNRAKEDRKAIAQWEVDREIDKKTQARLEQEAANEKSAKAASARIQAIAHAQDMAANKKPVITKIVADDVTAEKLASLLAEQGGFISVMSPEGGSIFGNLSGRYSKAGMPNLDTLLKGHAADDIRVDRQGREAEYVPRATINMTISPQPHVAKILGEIPGFRERGGAARMLACFPTSHVGYRSLRSKPIPDEVRESWHRLITSILELNPTRMTDSDGHRLPCVLHLSSAARSILLAFQHEIEAQMRPGASLSRMTDWGGKCPGAAVRIAGLLHIARYAHDPDTLQEELIEAETMENAITIMRYFAAHAQAFYDQLSQAGDLSQAREIWHAICGMPAEGLTKRRLFQRVRDRRIYQTADALDAPLATLEDLGYIRVIKQNPESGNRGGRPSVHILVNPLTHAQNLQNPQNTVQTQDVPSSEGIVYTESTQEDGDSDEETLPPDPPPPYEENEVMTDAEIIRPTPLVAPGPDCIASVCRTLGACARHVAGKPCRVDVAQKIEVA